MSWEQLGDESREFQTCRFHSPDFSNSHRVHGQKGYAVDMVSQNPCERFLNPSDRKINLKSKVPEKGSGDKIGYSHKCRKLLLFNKLSGKGCGEQKSNFANDIKLFRVLETK